MTLKKGDLELTHILFPRSGINIYAQSACLTMSSGAANIPKTISRLFGIHVELHYYGHIFT